MRLKETELFKDYICYKNYHKKMGRWQVCMIDKNDRTNRKTILYSKYIKSIEAGRLLEMHEEVDHVDGNKLNDRIDNLQIVSREENVRRRNKCIKKEIIDLICPNCGVEFKRAKNQTYLSKPNVSRTFCSRKCSGQYNSRKKNNG